MGDTVARNLFVVCVGAFSYPADVDSRLVDVDRNTDLEDYKV